MGSDPQRKSSIESKSASVGKLTVDNRGRITFADRAVAELFGKTQKDLIGQTYARACGKIFTCDGRPVRVRDLPISRPNEQPVSFDHCMQKPGREVAGLSVNATPIRSKSGVLVGSQLTIKDISEEIRAGVHRIEEVNHELMVESAREFIYLIDSDYRLKYANKSAIDFAQKEFSKVIGEKIDQIFPPAVNELLMSHLKEIFQSGQAKEFEVALRGATGETWLDARLMPIKDKSGRTTSIMGISQDITAQKTVESIAFENQERLALALEGAQAGLWDWNIKTGDVVFSDRWVDMLDYEPGEIEPRIEAWESLLHPDDAERVMKTVNDHFENRTASYSAEFRLKTKSGKWKWVLSLGKVWKRDKDNQPNRMMGIHIDINDRKQTEQVLHEREQMLKEAQRIAQVSSWNWDIASNELEWSDEAYHQLGVAHEEFGGDYESFLEFVHPDDRKLLQDAVEEALRGQPYNIEFRLVRRDGSTRIMESRGTVHFDDSGKPISLAGTGQDITERKAREAALVESESRFRSLIESSVDGIIAYDRNFNITVWNPGMEQISGGLKSEDVLGKNDFELFPFLENSPEGNAIKRAVRGQTTEHTEMPYQVPETGKKGYFESSHFLRFDTQGSIVGGMGIVRDVTEKREREDQLRQKDQAIRKAYADVFSAVTGDKLLFMTAEEIEGELDGSIDEPFFVSSFAELAGARAQLRKILFSRFPGIDSLIICAAGEVITNGIKHGGGCEVRICQKNGSAQIMVTDSGSGIDFSILPQATLLSGFSTKKTLGMGFSLMLEICDKVLLATQPGLTRVVLEKKPDE